MSLTKFNPRFGLFRDFDTVFDSMFHGVPNFGSTLKSSNAAWAPAVDVIEKENEFNLVADLPGIEKKDIDITVSEKVLTISGEKKGEEKSEDSHFSERRFGSFSRSFTLSENIDESNIGAEYKNGVLTLTLPKIEPVEPAKKTIKIS